MGKEGGVKEMRVGLIDIDNTKFPTLTLMKLSAWHKAHGDDVELTTAEDIVYFDLFKEPYDKIYASCIFSWNRPIAEKLILCGGVKIGGSGWNMSIKLPDEIEHIYPDYSLYGDEDTAIGFMTRGCPRQCPFCIVKDKEGIQSVKVADLSEFWHGQKNIEIMDPNLLACPSHMDLLGQLVDSGAWINIDQGLDCRLLTDENIALINQMKIKLLHFAWDNPRDKTVPRMLAKFAEVNSLDYRKRKVYCIANYWSTPEEDLERIYWLRENGYDPYLMLYDKQNAPRITRLMQRWVNNKIIFRSCERFEDYDCKRG